MSDVVIARQSLHNELVNLLHDMILKGELRPGERINEQALCTKFGVSRTPLREALKVLNSKGLLILSPNRGASVAKVTPEEIDALFPIIGALEALAGELACERIDEAGIRSIRKLHDTMLKHYEKGEAGPYLRANRQIHEALFEYASNRPLMDVYQNLILRTHSARYTARKSPDRWRQAVEDHVAMMAALEARDGKTLGAILKEHLKRKAEMVHESLQADQPPLTGPRQAGVRSAARVATK